MRIVPKLDEYYKRIGKDKSFNNKMLDEGLIKTYSIEDTFKMLNKIPDIKDKGIKNLGGEETILIVINNKPDIIENISNKMNVYGWQLVKKVLKNNLNILLVFHAKFGNEIVNNDNLIFYHVTPIVFYEKIQKIGLIPKSLNKNVYTGDRIFLYFSNNEEILKRLIEELFNKDKKLKYELKKNYVLLKVYVGKTNPKIRLFKDPDAEGAIYTMENIPPQLITPIKFFMLNQYGKVVKTYDI
jgi:flagellar biosynthesis regulator FlaF